jgi:hypothetical protein
VTLEGGAQARFGVSVPDEVDMQRLQLELWEGDEFLLLVFFGEDGKVGAKQLLDLAGDSSTWWARAQRSVGW